MLFKDAIDEFSNWRNIKVKTGTVRGYDRELRNLCLFLRNPDIEDIQINEVLEYLNGILELGWDRNSLLPRCMAIRKFFEFCRLSGYVVISEELIPVPRQEYKIPRVANKESYRQLLEVIPQNNDPRHIRNRAIINMLWDTGARIGELMSLDTDDISIEDMKAIVKTEKTRGRRPIREIYWTAKTSESLFNWMVKRSSLEKKISMIDADALFISVCAQKTGQRFTIKGAGEMLRRYSNRAGLEPVNAHSFRHSVGHRIIENGGTNSDVSNILGHSSLTSSFIYTMQNDKELKRRYNKLMRIDTQARR